MDDLVGYLIVGLVVVGVIVLFLTYVMIPFLTIVVGTGVCFGGGATIRNYYRAFKDNM